MGLEILTAVLVLVTGWYAWQTQQMVAEMRRARGIQVLPKLVPTLRHIGAGNAELRITNVGPGAVIAADVELRLEPGGPVRRWRHPVVVPGEFHDFAPEPTPNGSFHLDQLTEKYETFRLLGTCRDALGATHQIQEEMNIREYWRLVQEADETAPTEWTRETHRRLEGVEKALKAIAETLKRQYRATTQDARRPPSGTPDR
jgi:hypothetical protein